MDKESRTGRTGQGSASGRSSPGSKLKTEESAKKASGKKLQGEKASQAAAGEKLRFDKAVFTDETVKEATSHGRKTPKGSHAATLISDTVHHKIDQEADDNAGTDALNRGSQFAEHTAENGSNAFSRWRQKSEIKKEYAAAKAGKNAGTAASGAASGSAATAKNAGKAAKETKKVSERVGEFVSKHWHGLLIGGGILLVVIMISGMIGFCSVMFQGGSDVVVETSYTAEDEDILGVEADYCALEAALQARINNIESEFPGYDEINITQDQIGHNPYELASYLTVVFENYTRSQVQGTLQQIFAAQYELSFDSIVETRYRTETRTRTVTYTDPETGESYDEEEEYEVEVPYDYYILNVTLDNKGLANILLSAGLTDDQMMRYGLLMQTLGNKPEIFGDKLEAGIQALFESEAFKNYLKTLSKFHDYSLNNTILIAMQKPDATLVAGYTAWQKNFGRQVQKGETGIRILAPTPYKKQMEVDRLDPVTQKPVLNPDGSTAKDLKEIMVPAFKVVNVFDVSQTDGKPLPTIGVDELSGNVANYEMFFEALKRACPVPVGFEDIPSKAKGYYHTVEQRIALQEGMSEVQTVKTMIHEMAHQKLHAIDPKDLPPEEPRLTRNAKEVEAEAVAYTVAQHYGIETSDYSFAYIAGWSKDKDTPELKASLDRIRKAANEMIMAIDDHIFYLENEKNIEVIYSAPKEPAPGLQENGLYRYYSTQRPVDIGTFPKPADNKPVEIHNYDSRIPVENGTMQAWGWLEYAKPLTEKEASDYELRPAPSAAKAITAPEQSAPSSPEKKLSVLQELQAQTEIAKEKPTQKTAQKSTQKSHKKKEETR